MASLFNDELSKKMTSIKGTETYWSPEAAAGFATDKSDYWSLGIIIYEVLTGDHPYRHLSKKLRNYEMNVKEIKIPEGIESEYKNLLKGLLTKDPEKRWGIEEVRRWLNGERVEEHFEEGTRNNSQIVFKYDGNDFYQMEQLLNHLANKVNGRDELKKLFLRGHISNWFSRQGLVDQAMDIDDLREDKSKDTFDLFIKRYAPNFKTNSFEDFLSNLSIDRIKYEFKKLEKSGKLPWVAVGIGVLFFSGLWVPATIVGGIYYLKANRYRGHQGKNLFINEVRGIGRKIKAEIDKEFDNKKYKKDREEARERAWEEKKKRELDILRKKELAKIHRKKRRGRVIRTVAIVGGIAYFANTNPAMFPHLVTKYSIIAKNFFYQTILPIFYNIINILEDIFNGLF